MDEDIKVIHARKIYEVLNAIRSKPHVWLTSKSITALQNFLNGYMQLGFADDIYNEGEPPIDDFKYWILSKNLHLGSSGHWHLTSLLPACGGDEEKAFDRFFEYLDEFKREQKAS